MLSVGSQRIGIEEMIAGKGNAVENVVVHGPFQYVDVFAIAGHQEHPVVPPGVAHPGAGLTVS